MSGLIRLCFTSVLALASMLAAQTIDLEQTIIAVQEAINAGDLAAASRALDGALKAHPGDGGLLNLRGVVHARRNEIGPARQDFAAAVGASPRLLPAWQNLGRACQMQASADPDAARCAIASWQHVASANPNDMEAHAGLAQLYELQGEYSSSLRELHKLTPDVRSRTDNSLVLCADLLGLGQRSDATAVANQLASQQLFSESDLQPFERVLNSKQNAVVTVILLKSLDVRHPLSRGWLQQLAISYEQSGRVADARHTLERVPALDPSNPAHLIELARLAELTKDHEGALGYLGHARDLAPRQAQIHYLIAMIAAEMDLPIEARRSLDRALALQPDNPHYNYAMGYVVLSTRDAATAATYFQKFVSAYPSNPTGHYALGIAYFASGDYVKARLQMQIAEKSNKAAGADYFLGRMARIEGDLAEAADLLKKSIQLLPSFSPSHTELARVWMEQDRLTDAEKELLLATRLDPGNFLANEQLLALYKRTHDPRATEQSQVLKKLDEDRSKRAELMLRTIEFRP